MYLAYTAVTAACRIASRVQVELAAVIKSRALFLLQTYARPEAVSGSVSRKRWQLAAKRAVSASLSSSGDASPAILEHFADVVTEVTAVADIDEVRVRQAFMQCMCV